jgi:hypothetical protein
LKHSFPLTPCGSFEGTAVGGQGSLGRLSRLF